MAGRVGWARARTLGFVVAELSTILLDAVTDKDPVVREQVCSALCALGEAQPEEALGACEEYLRQHEKVLPAQGCGAGFLWASHTGSEKPEGAGSVSKVVQTGQG